MLKSQKVYKCFVQDGTYEFLKNVSSFRKQLPKGVGRKCVLENIAEFTVNYLCQILAFDKHLQLY